MLHGDKISRNAGDHTSEMAENKRETRNSGTRYLEECRGSTSSRPASPADIIDVSELTFSHLFRVVLEERHPPDAIAAV